MFVTTRDKLTLALDKGKFDVYDKNNPSTPISLRLDVNSSVSLKQKVRNSTCISFTKSSTLFLNDVAESISILDQSMMSIHLPNPLTFIDIPDNKLGFLLETTDNRDFTIDAYTIDDRAGSYGVVNPYAAISFNPLENKWHNSPYAAKLDDLLYSVTGNSTDSLLEFAKICLKTAGKNNTANSATLLYNLVGIFSHLEINPASKIFNEKLLPPNEISILIKDYLVNNKKLNSQEEYRVLDAISMVVEKAFLALASLYVLDQKSYIPVNWTHNVRNSQGLKKGLTYSILDIDVNAKTYLPKPVGIPTGSSAKNRAHEVRETWCVSHMTGKNTCKGICKPVEIDERRIKCLDCGKKSWLRKAHDRGDPLLGQVIKEYKSIVS